MADTVKQDAPKAAQGAGIWVLAATIIGSSMVFIDGTVVGVALPVLQRELNADAAQVQWVVEAYTLFLAALILVGGSLGDLFGRRRVFSIGIVIFAAASVWCGLAPDINQLIAGRAVQGIGGALLTPGSLSIISSYFNDRERGRAIGTWSSFTSITTVLGPVLGGWLVEHASWRWVFFINVPLAALTLFITYTRVPESHDLSGAKQLDWWGAGLATLGLGALVYGLIESNSHGLGDPLVLTTIGLGIAALVAFIVVESRLKQPMMPLGLFRSPTFSGANLLTFLLYAALAGAFFFLPFNLQQVQGYSPTASGAAGLPTILMLFLLSRWSGGLIPRFGAKLPLIIGPSIAAIGFFLFAVPGIGGSYWTTFFPAALVLGLGMAITVAPLTTAVMGAAPAHSSGIASGINNAVSRAAGLMAVAVLSIFAIATFSANLDQRMTDLNTPPAIHQNLNGQSIKLAAAKVPDNASSDLKPSLQQAIAEAFVAAFRLVMLICAGMALASALFAWWLVEGKPAAQIKDER